MLERLNTIARRRSQWSPPAVSELIREAIGRYIDSEDPPPKEQGDLLERFVEQGRAAQDVADALTRMDSKRKRGTKRFEKPKAKRSGRARR